MFAAVFSIVKVNTGLLLPVDNSAIQEEPDDSVIFQSARYEWYICGSRKLMLLPSRVADCYNTPYDWFNGVNVKSRSSLLPKWRLDKTGKLILVDSVDLPSIYNYSRPVLVACGHLFKHLRVENKPTWIAAVDLLSSAQALIDKLKSSHSADYERSYNDSFKAWYYGTFEPRYMGRVD